VNTPRANGSKAAAKLSLRLYVVSGAPNSITARANLLEILAELEHDSYAVEVVDCIADPRRALADGIIVTPTLMKVAPEPRRTVVGTLSDRRSVLDVLGFTPALPVSGGADE
jgi:circadian clock protein KaiB